jgi:hypothetical protein
LAAIVERGGSILRDVLRDTRFKFGILPIAGKVYVTRNEPETMKKLKNINKENENIENSISEAFQTFALGFLFAQCEQEKVQIDAKYGPGPLKLKRIDDEALKKIIFHNQLGAVFGDDPAPYLTKAPSFDSDMPFGQLELDLEYDGLTPEEATQLQRRMWEQDDEDRYCSADHAPEPDHEWKLAIYATDNDCGAQDGYLSPEELSAYLAEEDGEIHPYFSDARRRYAA